VTPTRAGKAPVVLLRPQSLPELRAIAAAQGALAGSGALPGALPPRAIVVRAIDALEKGADPVWSSFYVVLENGRAVASAGFKGPPREGRVEIGYNVAEARRGCGIATLAVRRLLAVAFAQPHVEQVRAETAVANLASRRVVEKCGFGKVGQRTTDDDGVLDVWARDRAP
jgi:ribosomal-protein-alanine N-acetyltransferase